MALVDAGDLYVDDGDGSKAIEAYEKASRLGLELANSALAMMWWTGKIVQQDHYKAMELWRRATGGGDLIAHAVLAEMEEAGREPETPRNLEEALYHWAMVCELAEKNRRDDPQARTRRANLARYFARRNDYRVLMNVWQRLVANSHS